MRAKAKKRKERKHQLKDASVLERLAQRLVSTLPDDLREHVNKSDQALHYLTDRTMAVASKYSAEERLRPAGLNRAIMGLEEAETNGDERTRRAAMDKVIFALVRSKEYQQLNEPTFKQLLLERFAAACEENELHFFIRFGRALSEARQARPLEDNKLAQFLVDNWKGNDNTPGLFIFSDEELFEVCQRSLHNSNLSLEALKKTRQKLGLRKRTGKPLVTKDASTDVKKCCTIQRPSAKPQA